MHSLVVEGCKDERSLYRGIKIGGGFFELTGGFLALSKVILVLMASWADVVVDRPAFPYNFSGVLLPLIGKLKGHRVHHGGDSWRVLCGVHKQS